MTTAAEQIAQLLFESGVRLESRYDTGAVFRAVEPTQTAILEAWLASIECDTDVAFNVHELRNRPAVQTLEQYVDSLLWARFEQMAYDKRNHFWQDVDAELWSIQCRDEREGLAQQRAQYVEDIGLRVGLPALLRAQA